MFIGYHGEIGLSGYTATINIAHLNLLKSDALQSLPSYCYVAS
jgi:hypothetical protein